MRKIFISLSFAFSFPGVAFASDFSNFYIVAYADNGNEHCSLSQPKADVIGADIKPLIFKGTRSSDSCAVNIQRSEFDERFEFCFLSGVKTVGQSGARQLQCDVGYSKGMWSFEAFIHASEQKTEDRKSVTCSFICKAK